jgi:hypothetical protein
METTNHDIQLEGKMVLLTSGVKLSLEKEYEEKYMYGNTVNNGTVINHIFVGFTLSSWQEIYAW